MRCSETGIFASSDIYEIGIIFPDSKCNRCDGDGKIIAKWTKGNYKLTDNYKRGKK